MAPLSLLNTRDLTLSSLQVEESQVAENTKITTVEKYVKDRFISLLNDSSEIPSDQHEFATCVFNCLWNYYK